MVRTGVMVVRNVSMTALSSSGCRGHAGHAIGARQHVLAKLTGPSRSWSVLGPHSMGRWRSSAGATGHDRWRESQVDHSPPRRPRAIRHRASGSNPSALLYSYFQGTLLTSPAHPRVFLRSR